VPYTHQVTEASAVFSLARERPIEHDVNVGFDPLALDVKCAIFGQNANRRNFDEVLEAFHRETLEKWVVKSQFVKSQRCGRITVILLSRIVLEKHFYLVFNRIQRHLFLLLFQYPCLEQLSVSVRLVLRIRVFRLFVFFDRLFVDYAVFGHHDSLCGRHDLG
jgi:hypothetical protein